MSKLLNLQPDSPSGAFERAVADLKQVLDNPAATMSAIADSIGRVLELLDTVLVETPTYAATRAVLLTNFRAIGHEFLEGRNGMSIRCGAGKDIDLHGKKVLASAWV